MHCNRVCFALGTAVVLLLTGCGSRDSQAKLEETQRQLEETKKKLQEAEAKAGQAPAQAEPQGPRPAEARPPAPVAPSAPGVRVAERAASTETGRAGPRSISIPAGTAIAVRTVGRISTKDAKNGDTFEATLAQPLVVDGETVAKRGATVTGVVTESDPGGRVKGVASLSLALTSLVTADGEKVRLQTNPVTRQAQKSVKKDALKVGIASGVGAAIGAIAGGGKGAAIGAGVGAAGGTGVAMATRGEAAEIPPETVLTFRLAEPVRVK